MKSVYIYGFLLILLRAVCDDGRYGLGLADLNDDQGISAEINIWHGHFTFKTFSSLSPTPCTPTISQMSLTEAQDSALTASDLLAYDGRQLVQYLEKTATMKVDSIFRVLLGWRDSQKVNEMSWQGDSSEKARDTLRIGLSHTNEHI